MVAKPGKVQEVRAIHVQPAPGFAKGQLCQGAIARMAGERPGGESLRADHGDFDIVAACERCGLALDEDAVLLNAVNCVSFEGDTPVGHNTDGDGCCDALIEQGGARLRGATVVLLGAGGTAQEIIAMAKLEPRWRFTAVDPSEPMLDAAKQQLQANDLMPEDWGGTTSCVEISATKGTNVDQLLEIILLEAEMLELKADPKAPVRAIAVESRVEAGTGPTATGSTRA